MPPTQKEWNALSKRSAREGISESDYDFSIHSFKHCSYNDLILVKTGNNAGCVKFMSQLR